MIYLIENMNFVPAYTGKNCTLKRSEFKGKFGLYFIVKGGDIIYIGNSRSCVYSALYRHFQKFSPENVYIDRNDCEVCIIVLPKYKVFEYEKENIMFYKPFFNRKIYNVHVKKSVNFIDETNNEDLPF